MEILSVPAHEVVLEVHPGHQCGEVHETELQAVSIGEFHRFVRHRPIEPARFRLDVEKYNRRQERRAIGLI